MTLKNMYDAAELGRYNLAFAMGRTAFDVIGAALNTWAFVSLSQQANEDNIDQAKAMLTQQMSLIVAAYLPTGAVIISIIDLIARILFKDAYYVVFMTATPIVVAGAIMLNLRMYVYDNVYFLCFRNVLQIPPLALGAMTSMAIGLPLVSRFPILGGSIMFASGSLVALLASIFFSGRLTRIGVNWTKLSISVGISVVCFLAITLLKKVLEGSVPPLVVLAACLLIGLGFLLLSVFLCVQGSRVINTLVLNRLRKKARACGHSLCGEDCRHEVPVGRVTAGSLLVARGDGPELLDLREEVLDQMSPLIGMPVVIALDLTVRFRRNDCARAAPIQLGKQPVGIEGLVGQKSIEGHVVDQRCDAFEVMSLTRQDNKVEQVSERIDQRHDLGGQSAARAPDGLSVSSPLAPLAFW